jgi:tRNA(Met) C34 N-acetyltransferase TmcA
VQRLIQSTAAALAHGYANIFVTSPSPENLMTLFECVFKGFGALGYEEHLMTIRELGVSDFIDIELFSNLEVGFFRFL